MDDSRFMLLMQINHDAFDEGQYNVAYHALAGALHWAKDGKDHAKVVRAKTVAETQALHIDEHAAEYEFSRPSTRRRYSSGNIGGLYHSLARQAGAFAFVVAYRNEESLIGQEESSSSDSAKSVDPLG